MRFHIIPHAYHATSVIWGAAATSKTSTLGRSASSPSPSPASRSSASSRHTHSLTRQAWPWGPARAAAMHLVGVPGAVHFARRSRRPHDPIYSTFAYPISLIRMPLGAFPTAVDDQLVQPN